MAKKTKKIDTPIDQRETFVSIQKNFADSDLSVSEKLQTLYALQQADTEIDKILQLRGELPVEVEHLEAEIADLKAKSARIAEQIEAYTKSIAENKNNISECDTQIEKYKSQLENVANSREFDSLNKEIENQGLLRQIAEKNIYETKEMIMNKKGEAEIVKEGNKLVIRDFYPLNLMNKLSMQKEVVDDWRVLTDSVKIDFNYDGSVFSPTVIDVPNDNELVSGIYEIPSTAGNIRVKITDLLSESYEVTIR